MHGNRYVQLHEQIIRCSTTQMTKKSFQSVISDSKQVTSCTSMLIAGVMSVSVSTRVLVGG